MEYDFCSTTSENKASSFVTFIIVIKHTTERRLHSRNMFANYIVQILFAELECKMTLSRDN